MASFSIHVPQNRGKQCCSIRPLVQLLTTTPVIYPLPLASTSLTTIHSSSSSSSSNLTLGFIQTHGIPISFFLRYPDWKMEKREVGEGLITSHNNCRILLLAVSATPENWFLSPGSLRSVSCLGTIDNPPQRISDYNNNNGHDPEYYHHQLHSVGGTTVAFCTLQMSIRIPDSNSNSYTLRRYSLYFAAT